MRPRSCRTPPPVQASNVEVARALPGAINSLLTQAGKACRLGNVDQRVDQGIVPGVPPQRGTAQHMVPVNVSLGAASRADGSFQGGEQGAGLTISYRRRGL